MNDFEQGTRGGGGAGERGPGAVESTLEVLVARIVDNRADAHDWDTFRALAESHERGPAWAWQRLAECQRDSAMLSIAVGAAAEAASRVRLAGASAGGAGSRVRRLGSGDEAEGGRAWARAQRWGGWAVAATLALAWIGASRGLGLRSGPGLTPGEHEASIAPAHWKIDSPEDAVKAYLDLGAKSGRVLGELPERVVVQAAPANSAGAIPPAMLERLRQLPARGSSRAGGAGTGAGVDAPKPGQIEVIYVRQFVERALVSDVMKFDRDEAGNAVPVRMPIQTFETRPE